MNKLTKTWLFSVILTIVCLTSMSGQINIGGIVTDKLGMPLPGATIIEKGTKNATATDLDGKFQIKVSAQSSVLEASYIGFVKSVFKVGTKNEINFTLNEDISTLNEVVVIGYQTVKKSDVTGSVSKINTEKLSEIPSNSIEGLLQGRVSGLVISNSSDDPGAALNVRIRGASSFTATTPLIVVDGFPLGDAGNLKQINPADIVSVEVLKDASAASIYGSRGANGVILVTTRRGKEGKSEFNFTAITSLSSFASKFNIFSNPVDLAITTDEARVNGGLLPIYIGGPDVNGTYYPSVGEIRKGYPTTDYVNYVYRNPVNHNYNFSAYGGSEKTKYNFGLNFNTQDGIVRANELSKVTVSFGIDQKLSEKVSLSTNLNFSRGDRNDNGGLSFNRNMLFPLYNKDGSYYKFAQNDFDNPAALTALRKNEAKTLDLISSSILLWQITDGLKFKSQFNYSLGSSIQDRYFPNTYTQLGFEGNGVGFIDNFQSQRVVVDAYFTYHKNFKEIHDFTLLAGYSSEYFEQRTSQLRGQDFVNDVLGAGNLSLGKEQRVSNDLASNTLQSAISRFNYGFKDKLLFTFTGRVDGSSKFGVNNQYAFFPSGAISWKMQNEKFIKEGLPFVNELKPRLSYGIVGNQAIGNFETLNRLGQGRFFTNGSFATTIGPAIISRNGNFIESRGLGNPDLKWETTKILNFGLDFSGFNRRLDVIIDLYNKTTKDLLVDSSLPPTSGFDFVRINAGEIENKGIEIAVNYKLIKKADFNLSAGIIFNKNANKVISLGPPSKTSVLSDEFGNQFRFTGTNYRDQYRSRVNVFAIDQPINVFYGAKVRGIIQSEAEGLTYGLTGAAAQPGEFLYEDLNGDGVIDPFGKDRTIIGDPNPDFSASFTLDATYKKWDLAVLFNGSFGGEVVNINQFSTGAGGGQANNLLSRWTPDNRSNDFPSLRQNRSVAFSDWWIQDASFVRIQNLRIGYNLPTDQIKFFTKAKIYFSGDNLYSFTNYKGVAPEVNIEGIDENSVPRLRRYSLGIQLSF
ncbi:TonB-dependent receptor [Flavobacterium sp. PL002]|uniref:SusC/RagA family TonB-linked outer membrane protein n=1 Tax=Flavobacterium sp. PL002 TaxID=1897058 RepID=UPI00178841D3|nr:TonB-dependent receptor [Flavobacterium sp. PL002]MBE0391022.1 TonB-dependent receptor SusC [Flavobacterium sp. PL002]